MDGTYHDSETPDVSTVRVAGVEYDLRRPIYFGLDAAGPRNVSQHREVKVRNLNDSSRCLGLSVVIAAEIDDTAIDMFLWKWVVVLVSGISF